MFLYRCPGKNTELILSWTFRGMFSSVFFLSEGISLGSHAIAFTRKSVRI